MEKTPANLIDALMHDRIVTIPTETVEGYAVRLSSETGIIALMRLKDRDFDSGKFFTLVPESVQTISKYAIIPTIAEPLIAKHIPGELTLVLPKNPDFHHFYYDHFNTIGIRIPDHPLFAEILPHVGPLVLTSANLRGGTPHSFTGHRPSTVVDCTGPTPQILRQGDLHLEF